MAITKYAVSFSSNSAFLELVYQENKLFRVSSGHCVLRRPATPLNLVFGWLVSTCYGEPQRDQPKADIRLELKFAVRKSNYSGTTNPTLTLFQG